MKVGYVGLGNMGAPMARRLLEWPGGLTVYDIRAEAVTPLTDGGAIGAVSLAEVAAAQVICVTVLDDAQVRTVVTEIAAHAAPGTVLAVHSTISPDTATELAEALRPKGIHVIDAPVSGGGAAADKGELAVMVGAEREVYERVKPVFRCFASLVIHAGPPGAGTRMKLARNMLTFTGFAAAGEAVALAAAAGVDVAALGRVVRHTDALTGGPGALMLLPDAAELTQDHWLSAGSVHTRTLGTKDLGLALDLGDALGVDLPLAELAKQNLPAALGVPFPDHETP
jgi:3-hydroxyisobutyrate dehydrogenase-like beta-hydroxyacid dehydrogenase